MRSYTGVDVLEHISSEIINQLYKEKKVEVQKEWTTYRSFSQNQYFVLKSDTSQSAITRVKGGFLHLVQNNQKASGLQARNKEQTMALDALTDDSITTVVMTGRAGTGKTLLALCAALQKVDEKVYDKIILTRPMSQVGERDLGILPGEIEDKFLPYLQNYFCNLSVVMPLMDVETIIRAYNVEFVPLQLIRGASWNNCFILADETQVLNYHEMLTLGTRVGEGSKIVIMGDLKQRDEDIEVEKTGIYRLMNDSKAKDSPLVAGIELWKCERSATAMLFSDIFE